MLKNTPVLPYIHKLWLIAIVENQFNRDLQQLWKYNIIPHTEDLDLVINGQKVGRIRFQTHDWLLLQIIFL